MLQKLGELVTELYLADKQAKKDRLWDRAHKAMVKLKITPAIIDHIMKKQDVEILAKNLQDWQGGKKQAEVAGKYVRLDSSLRSRLHQQAADADRGRGRKIFSLYQKNCGERLNRQKID